MRFKLDNYKIGEVAHIYGVTVETIRFYNKCGIIEPERSNNNYRTYKKEEVISMDYVMRLRDLDISLEKVKEITDIGDLNSLLEAVEDKEDEIRKQIENLENKVQIINSYKSKIKKCQDEENKIRIITSPGFLIKDLTSDVKHITNSFHSISPVLSPMISVLMSPDDICLDGMVRNRNERYNVCNYYMVAENTAKDIDFNALERNEIVYIPPQQCVHSVVKVHTNTEYGKCMEIFDYIDTNNYKICGNTVIQLVAMESRRDKGIEYYEIWIPVRKNDL